ncbi:MAG: hypothetical protein CL816_06740 [Coxiellaceae bacterium]|nr:hypothetical protein [Coxiellaceae bacterium]|tara:strand:+ start:1319 stop:1876 length:558 start_codon:yes stop_codon:yes gene_type:complete
MKKTITPILSTALLAVTTLSLCACSSTTKPVTHSSNTPSVVNNQHGYSSGYLSANDVHVVRIGESVQIIIPSDRVFNTSSANLASSSKGILYNTAQLVKHYNTNRIEVAAYTDSTVGNGISQDRAGVALTNAQAQAISSYLWSQGIDTRYIYSVGHGSANPVASNSTPRGQYDNRRVVISFQYHA